LRSLQFAGSSAAAWVGWLIYLGGILLLCAVWQRSKSIEGRLLGLSILIALVTAPHLHLHDLTLLILPLLFIARERMTPRSEQRWAMLPLGASLFLLIGILLDAVYYILPYLLFGMLAYLLITPGRTLKDIAGPSPQP
jgi:hypothetical protein